MLWSCIEDDEGAVAVFKCLLKPIHASWTHALGALTVFFLLLDVVVLGSLLTAGAGTGGFSCSGSFSVSGIAFSGSYEAVDAVHREQAAEERPPGKHAMNLAVVMMEGGGQLGALKNTAESDR